MSMIDRCARCDRGMGYRQSGHSWCDKCRDEDAGERLTDKVENELRFTVKDQQRKAA